MPELPLTLSGHSKPSVTIGRFFRFRVLTTEAPKIRLESFGCSVRSGQADPLGAGTQAGKGAEMNENELHLWLELLSQMTEEEKAQFLELLKQLARL